MKRVRVLYPASKPEELWCIGCVQRLLAVVCQELKTNVRRPQVDLATESVHPKNNLIREQVTNYEYHSENTCRRKNGIQRINKFSITRLSKVKALFQFKLNYYNFLLP